MNRFAIPILNDALNEYYTYEELEKLCSLFDVNTRDFFLENCYFDFVEEIVMNIEIGNNHKLLNVIFDSLCTRSRKKITSNQWQKREYHEDLLEKILGLSSIVKSPGLPSEISVQEKKPFSAKPEARELFECAVTEIFIVDQYIGPATLDCLRGIERPVRLLTGKRSNNIANGFDNVLIEFLSEGQIIEIRRHDKLHDRYIGFNDRCWLVGSSLKDAGKKAFNIIEFIDSKRIILAEINSKWEEAIKYEIKPPDNK